MESAVVLLSGGVGSAVAAFRSREDTAIYPVYLDYGRASAKSERLAASAVAKALGAPLQVLDLTHVAQIAAAGDGEPERREQAPSPIPHPPGDVNGLMTTMLAVGAEFAAAVGAAVLVSGHAAAMPSPQATLLSQERTVNPRQVFHAFSILLEAALPAVRPIRLETPLIDLQPTEVVKLGRHLQVPFELTWSCHRDAPPCGTCPGCRVRQSAFATAGVPDPLQQEALLTVGDKVRH